jgi:transcription termination/antitermination protein NusA
MIQLDMRIIGFINVFEKITRAGVKDCFEEGDSLIFVVQPGEARRAVGEGGKNLVRLSKLMKKEVKVIQFSKSPDKFLSNLLYPLRPELEVKEGFLVIKAKDAKEKGRIFGRERSNLKRIQTLMDRYFAVAIKVE